MRGKLGFVTVVLGLALPALAAQQASISGYVRSANGVPQMGAVVEILGSTVQGLRYFTDEKGYFSATGVVPGVYSIRASAPSFLPALRERIGVRAGAAVKLNLTLSTLFDSIQFAPTGTTPDSDDWKWVLRSVSNRPILRVFDDSVAGKKSATEQHDVKGALAFFAGAPSSGFGSASDMNTGFSMEKSLFSAGTVGLSGDLGYGEQSPAAVLRTSYRHKLSNGSEPEIALTMRRLPTPGFRDGTLQAFALTTSDSFTLGDVVELKFGSELQTIQFMGRVTAFRPFGSAGLHLSPDTIVEYRYATSQPDERAEKGFESAPADLSESGPRVSLAGFQSALERSHHHELSLSHRFGRNSIQLAAYRDRISDPALTGVGEVSSEGGEAIPSFYSGTFIYRGRNLDTNGFRLVLERKLVSDLTATVDYEYGGVLDLGKGSTLETARDSMLVQNRQSVAGKLKGRITRTGTRWIASYRWTDGTALTPVDMFNESPGQTDPYLGIFVRQPIPGPGFLTGHMDALLDIRNLLAQGYVPLVGQDGRTVYLVQAARSVRGGVAFTF